MFSHITVYLRCMHTFPGRSNNKKFEIRLTKKNTRHLKRHLKKKPSFSKKLTTTVINVIPRFLENKDAFLFKGMKIFIKNDY